MPGRARGRFKMNSDPATGRACVIPTSASARAPTRVTSSFASLSASSLCQLAEVRTTSYSGWSRTLRGLLPMPTLRLASRHRRGACSVRQCISTRRFCCGACPDRAAGGVCTHMHPLATQPDSCVHQTHAAATSHTAIARHFALQGNHNARKHTGPARIAVVGSVARMQCKPGSRSKSNHPRSPGVGR